MEEKKPLAVRFADEIDAFFDLWRKRRILAVLFLIVVVGFVIWSLWNWQHNSSKIRDLQNQNRELTSELNLLRAENISLKETVAPLLLRAAKEFPGEEINVSLKKLLEKLEVVDPNQQPIRTATATVEVSIASFQQENSHYMDRGGYLAFGKGDKALLIMSSTDCDAKQTGKGAVAYRGILNMDATDPSVGKPVSFLKEAEYIQISFLPIPPKSKVLSGYAICTINNSVRIEIKVPPQLMVNNLIVIRNLEQVLSVFK